jgi:hypothetical protein
MTNDLALLARAVVLSCVVGFVFSTSLAVPDEDAAPRQGTAQQIRASDEIVPLWSANIEPMLSGRIHSSDQAYTEGQELLVPLHAAFRLGNDTWQHSFSDHFSRLASNPSVLPAVVLSRLEYLYLASEFLVLAEQAGRQDLIPSNLPDLLFSEFIGDWRNSPAWQWGRNAFPGGIRERVLWKLKNRKVEKSYYRAFVDDDLFLLAIAADLKSYGGTPDQARKWGPALEDALRIAFKIFSEEGVAQPDGGWLFQPGVWEDHPEYQYAGNLAAQPGIRPAPVPGIAADSSHSMRFAAWLTSFMLAYSPASNEHRFYAGLRAELENQFFDKVLVLPSNDHPCYLLKNFMDGSNGVYRWNYASLGKGVGYGPYDLSGSLLLGWWSLFGTDRIQTVYSDLARRFPWPPECVEFYLSPTPGQIHPDSAFHPDSPTMRLWHTLVELASAS